MSPDVESSNTDVTKGNKRKKTEETLKDGLRQVPKLEVAQLRFLIAHNDINQQERSVYWRKFIKLVELNDMAPYYQQVCQELRSDIDAVLLNELKERNEKRFKELDDNIKDAEENHGEMEIRQAYLHKSEYYCQIGEEKRAVEALTNTLQRTSSIGYRIDLYLCLIRHGLFFLDHHLCNLYISKAKNLLDLGCGDWEHRNCLRAYEGVYKVSVRDFKGAARRFLDVIQTFDSTELISYNNLIFYAVICGIYSLERSSLRTKVMHCNEIQEQLASGSENNGLLLTKNFLNAFYECKYDELFTYLIDLEEKHLKFDRYFSPHLQFYTKAILLRAYRQYLTPYAAVRLDVMAKHFRISVDYLDMTLYRFIASGQLRCSIDAVRGIVTMMRPDSVNKLYKNVIRDGDILLNRLQNLSSAIQV